MFMVSLNSLVCPTIRLIGVYTVLLIIRNFLGSCGYFVGTH
jgi:hypothetical protein